MNEKKLIVAYEENYKVYHVYKVYVLESEVCGFAKSTSGDESLVVLRSGKMLKISDESVVRVKELLGITD